MNWRILCGDVREQLQTLEAGSVQTCVTSPPYWGLRDYGHAGQIGLEAMPDAYVANLVRVFADVRRVLRDDGTLWLNLGDSYAGGGTIGRNDTTPDALARRAERYGTGTGAGSLVGSQGQRPAVLGMKPKDLVGIPWRVAFALQADGWYLRSDIIWSKPNPMPESVTDRPTKAHEYLFLLSKRASYYYDAAAIAESSSSFGRQNSFRGDRAWQEAARVAGGAGGDCARDTYDKQDRNKRSVWHVATQPYPDAHFATYPEALIEPCILAGSKPGDLILDPFTGSGTTGAVAIRHQRQFVGVELNPAYVQLARKRIGSVAPLFAVEATA